jgi:hypothetical protein
MNKTILLVLILLFSVEALAQEVMVLDLHYDDGFITMKDKTILLGYYPDRNFQPSIGYRLEVVSFDDTNLYSFRFKLPLDEFLDYNTDKLQGGVIRVNETDFSLIVPYFDDAKEINFYNERNYKVAEVNLVDERFAPKGVVFLVYVIVILLIIGLILLIKKRK